MKIVCTASLLLLACLAPHSASAQEAAQAAAQAPAARMRSRIFVYDLRDASSTLVFTADQVWEAPNWSPDGRYLIANSDGHIYKLTLAQKGTAQKGTAQKEMTQKEMATPTPLAIPPAYVCNNDKALSPDGRSLAFSASLLTNPPSNQGSEVYLANADGTNIRPRTTVSPSYFHGWSPDGRTLAFVAQRNGSGQFDVYRVPTVGGPEHQLNLDPHHDDGPDYSPDGRWIYINSDRSGHESIWRFPASGAGPDDAKAERVLSDGAEDWFPHLSPDGSKLVYLAYPAGTPTHNPRDLQVTLKLTTVDHDHVQPDAKALATFLGGQGTINVNSWAPDSQRFAYVVYEPIP